MKIYKYFPIIKRFLKLRNKKDVKSFIKKHSYKNEIFYLLTKNNYFEIMNYIVKNDDVALLKIIKLPKYYKKQTAYCDFLERLVINNSIKTLKYFLNKKESKSLDFSETYLDLLSRAISEENKEITYYLINNPYYNLIKKDDYSIIMAIKNNNEKLFNILLQHKNTDVIGYEGQTFYCAWELGNQNIINALWKDEKIRNSLEENDYDLFVFFRQKFLCDKLYNF
jgi:hypothetical protein